MKTQLSAKCLFWKEFCLLYRSSNFFHHLFLASFGVWALKFASFSSFQKHCHPHSISCSSPPPPAAHLGSWNQSPSLTSGEPGTASHKHCSSGITLTHWPRHPGVHCIVTLQVKALYAHTLGRRNSSHQVFVIKKRLAQWYSWPLPVKSSQENFSPFRKWTIHGSLTNGN